MLDQGAALAVALSPADATPFPHVGSSQRTQSAADSGENMAGSSQKLEPSSSPLSRNNPNQRLSTPAENRRPVAQVSQAVEKGAKSAPKSKAGRTSESDSINALLSLGRDLTASEAEKVMGISSQLARNENGKTTSGTGQKSSRKRQKQSIDGATSAPSDFWYWLSDNQAIGEWDVLCGRGGESNNYVGNKKYRKIVDERKEAYRSIPLKQRKAKTAFVKSIVHHINNCGGRFVDMDETSGRYYVVTMEKARKKTSQALRETKELKWLETEQRDAKLQVVRNTVCPYCKLPGHKTKIAKACLYHREWLDASSDGKGNPQFDTEKTSQRSDTKLKKSDVPSSEKKLGSEGEASDLQLPPNSTANEAVAEITGRGESI